MTVIAQVRSAEHPRSVGAAAGVTLAPDVVLLHLTDGSVRLLDFGGSFYALSASAGSLLTTALDKGIESTVHALAAIHGVPPAQVRTDLLALLADLEQQGVVRLRRSPSGGQRRTGRSARLVAAALRPLLSSRLPLPLRATLLLGLAAASLSACGWSATVAAWQRASARQPSLADAPVLQENAASCAATVRAALAGHPLPLDCKHCALACWALLRSEGLPAQLVVGVDFFPFAAHCWCELDGVPVSDFPDRCERFIPVRRYGDHVIPEGLSG